MMSYRDYVQGLRMLQGRGAPETRSDYELAERTLESLRGAVIGAGSNTWREAKERYRLARRTFNSFPVPCQVTLYHVAEPCQNLGTNGACEKCSETVKNVMHNTCARYGIALG
jgi:hypothetical protein